MISSFLCPRTRDLFITGNAALFGGSSLAALRLLDMLQCITSPLDFPSAVACRRVSGSKTAYSLPVDEAAVLRFSWSGASAANVRILPSGSDVPGADANPPDPLPLDTEARRIVSHPGRVLQEHFMIPRGISANRLSAAMQVPVSRILDIINERRGVSADTASRLSLCVGASPRFWAAMQSEYELSVIRMEKDLASLPSLLPGKA